MKIHENTKIGEKRMIGRFLSVQRGLVVFACLIFMICGPRAAFSTSEKSYDVLIKGGTIYDGTLKPPYVADIGIKNDNDSGSESFPERQTRLLMRGDSSSHRALSISMNTRTCSLPVKSQDSHPMSGRSLKGTIMPSFRA